MKKGLRLADRGKPILSCRGSAPEDVATGLRACSESVEMLSNGRQRLIDKQPSQWIGVHEGKMSAKADDLPVLMDELEKRGIRPGDTIVRFIEENRRTSIL